MSLFKSNGCWLSIIVFLSTIVSLTVFGLIYLLIVIPRSPLSAEVIATPPGQVLTLPTARPTSEVMTSDVPPTPTSRLFKAQNPVRGFSECERYGFQGVVRSVTGSGLANVHVVVWAEDMRVLRAERTDVSGVYEAHLLGQAEVSQVWIQLYQNDLPVSEAINFDIQEDCQTGYQLYQIDWQAVRQ